MLVNESEIRSRLGVARLPTMPQLLTRLMEQCQNEKAGLPELAKLVSYDPGLTAKILRTAQSPAYRRRGQNVGLEQSMMALGLDMIRTLVISESVFHTFNGFSTTARTDLRAFWKHSLTTAIIARQAAKVLKYANVNEAYLAGLLHDIGRLSLLSVAPNEYASHFHAADDDRLCAAEQRTLQMSHAEAGALVVERWKLDSFIADSVLYHHESGERIANSHPLIRIVWLANALSSPGADTNALESAARQAGASAKDTAAIMKGVDATVEQAADFLGIDLRDIDAAPPTAVTHVAPDPLGDEIQQFVHSSELGRFFSGFQDEEQLLRAMCGTACSDFQFEQICLMLRNEDDNALLAYPLAEDQQRLAGYSLALDKPGPISVAVLQDWFSILESHDAANGIAEEQLMRLLGAQRLACLPLTAHGECLGVLLASVGTEQIPQIRASERTLKNFRTQAATALASLRARIRADEARAARQETQFREASRRVAHEVNNPLAIIKNYLRVLDGKLTRQEAISGEISILGEEIDRVGQIISGFADQSALTATEHADANRCIRDVAHLFGNTGSSVRITARTHANISSVNCSAGKLKQILLNLVKNAIEAMPQGGEVTVANEGAVIQQGIVYLCLSVGDNGPGIPPDILAQLFSPVKSTKGADHRGLGLNIVHGLVTGADGSISCQSDPNGTVFRVFLPGGLADGQHSGL